MQKQKSHISLQSQISEVLCIRNYNTMDRCKDVFGYSRKFQVEFVILSKATLESPHLFSQKCLTLMSGRPFAHYSAR